MVVKRGLGIDVVTAAKQRIIDTFSHEKKINMSFSGGKDSIVMAHIVYELLQSGVISPALLTVTFIDEEAMYDDVIQIVKNWRMKFIEIGVKFDWYCLQVKHYSCLHSLSDEESYILWDKTQKENWMREMPEFAITDDPFYIPYKDNYQSFLERKEKAYNMISLRGVRVSESIQRQKVIAARKDDRIVCPIYDMTDKDIWLYIWKYGIEYPKTYEDLYRIGTPTNMLRISQFFSIDTAKSLVSLSETHPDLMERVMKREPNAYLCAMYWDTEMFGRSTGKRKQLEEGQEQKDYKKIAIEIMRNPNAEHPEVVKKLKPHIAKASFFINNSDWKMIYQVLCTGDPKGRQCRAIVQKIYGKEKTRYGQYTTS